MPDLLTDLRALAAQLQGQIEADDVEARSGRNPSSLSMWWEGHREGVRLSRNRLLAIVEKHDGKE